MKTFLKILLGLVVAVVALTGAAILIVSTLDANRYKPQIIAKVREITHREMTIGDIHFSLYPVLGARLRDVTLANATGFGNEPFTAIGTTDVGVRLLPLLFHRRIEVAKLELRDARFNLATATDGRNNWDDLTPKPAVAPEAKPSTPSAGAPAAAAFTIESITIDRAALHYDDHKSGAHYAIDDFHFKAGPVDPAKPFDVALGFKTALDHPLLTATISAQGKARFDQVQKTYGVDGLDLKVDATGASLPNGKLALQLKGNVVGAPDSVQLSGMNLALDDTHVTGDVALTNLTQKAAKFALRIDQLDVDRYTGKPEPGAAAAPPSSTDADNDDNTPLPVDALDTFTASGTLDIGTLKAKGATLTDVQLNINAQRGGDKRLQLAAKLYGGTIAAHTVVTPGGRPRYAQTARLQNISIGPLLQALIGKDSLSGNGNVALDLTGAGRTVGELKRALNGDVSASLHNGAFKGFNLAEIVRQGEALAQGQQLQQSGTPPETDFSAIDFKGHIVNGVLHDDLSGQSPYFRVSGNGQADLVHKTIDYLAKPTIVKSPAGQGGLVNMVGLTVPIQVGGTFSAPSYRVDVQSALKQEAVKKLTDRLTGKNPGLADTIKGLGALFGGHRNNNPPAQNAPTQ